MKILLVFIILSAFFAGCVSIPELPVIPTMPSMEIPTIPPAAVVPTPLPTTVPPTTIPTLTMVTTIAETPTTAPTPVLPVETEPTVIPVTTTETPTEVQTTVAPNPKMLSVVFLDVGQGDSTLITYNDTAVLIDAGKTDYGPMVVADLKKFGVSHLTYAIMTHEHEDHFGGFQEVFNTYKPDTFVYTSCGTTTCTNRVLIPLGDSAERIQPRAGTLLYLDPDIDMRVLSPPQGGFSDINEGSIVVLLKYYDSSFLFMGDAEEIAEEYMMDTYDKELDTDVFKVGHHGSDRSVIQEFLDATTPQVAVISVGEDNSYGHPTQSTLDLLTENNINILRTDSDGNILITTDGSDMVYKTRA